MDTYKVPASRALTLTKLTPTEQAAYAAWIRGERAAAMYTLIGTAKLNDIDPQAWLADVLDRIANLPQTRLPELLPWHWKAERQQALAA